jgi:hypothetical protein
VDPLIGYPIQLKTIYQPSTGTGQPIDLKLYDMDGDKYPELIYCLDGSGDSLVLSNSLQIAKYDTFNNTFNIVYQNRPSIYSIHTRGFAFGDIDSDGKQNFAVSNEYGEVFVYEYNEANNYYVVRIDSLPISNAYLQLFTNDLDHNGKSELWIGGDGYINGVSSKILYIFEANGDNQYSIVYSIAVIGGSTWFAMNMLAADVDNDGTDEVLLCIDQHLVVLKNSDSNYALYYIKQNELSNQNSTYTSATVADFDGDNYPELIISMDLVENNALKGFSRIYKKSSTLDVSNSDPHPHNYYLSDAYPNPFNPSTTIIFKTIKEGIVSIRVYDVLGKEIKTLLNDTVKSGEYLLCWNGKDSYGNRVSSGIYLINMVSGSFNKSIKTILIK